MQARSVLRVLRAGVFAAVCVLLASLGHSMMSGSRIPGWMIAVAWVGTAGVAWFMTGKERGPLLICVLTVSTQAFLHMAFSLGQAMTPSMGGQAGSVGGHQHPAAHHMPVHADGSMADHAHHMYRSAAHMHHAASGAAGSGAHAPTGLHDGMHDGPSGMLAAHLLVALLSAWWMWGGERAVFQLVRATSARLFTPLVLALAPAPPAAMPVLPLGRFEPPCLLGQLFLSHVMWLRGPPRGLAV